MAPDRSATALRVGLVLLAAAVVLWVRVLPTFLPTIAESEGRSELLYRGDDGREHVYLGDYDSYLWLRHARNYLRTGTTCDAVVDGECRDTYANAPVGRRMLYGRSLHIAAIVGLDRLIALLRADYPLPATAFWVPVLVGLLGTLPAFLLGERLAGPLAGFAAAVLIGVDPLFLRRSIGGDNDVWNVVLPLWIAWTAVEAISAERTAHRIAWALAAAAFTGLQAATWRGWLFVYAVVSAGLLANVLLLALRRVTSRAPASGRSALAGAAIVLLVFVAGGTMLARLAGAEELLSEIPRQAGRLIEPARRDVPVRSPKTDDVWPDTLTTVAELVRPSVAEVAGLSQGVAYFVLAALGMVLLVLPSGAWRWWHFGILAGGIGCCGYLLLRPDPSPRLIVGVLALPVALAAVLAAVDRRGEDDSRTRAALVVVAWALAALSRSEGRRFVLLLVPAVGLLAAGGLGRVHARLSGALAGSGRWTKALLFVLLAAPLVLVVRQGAAAARAYVPVIHDAWWDALVKIRDTTPRDAIVDTWWDYGHWVKYVAERRVTADGASLLTHVPYWTARAFATASEREAVGLFRMLNCGSDATPEPEGREGAYGKLRALNVDPITAQAMIVALASLDRAEAERWLAARGVDGAAAADVLRSTHCTPPPAYLLLSEDLARRSGWRYLGNWDFGRAYVARVARALPETEAVSEIVRRFQLPEASARALRAQALALPREEVGRKFIGPAAGYLVPHWLRCEPEANPADWRCPVGQPVDASGRVLLGLLFRPEAPLKTRLFLQKGGSPAGKADQVGTPATLLVAREDAMEELSFPNPTLTNLGVLVDTVRRRALVGAPYLLRSTFTHLVFLDGRYARYFEKFDDRVGEWGERVTTWRIEDPGT